MPDILMRPEHNYRLVTERCEFYDYFHQFFYFVLNPNAMLSWPILMQMTTSSVISKYIHYLNIKTVSLDSIVLATIDQCHAT